MIVEAATEMPVASGLRATWEGLAAEVAPGTPFHTPEWFECCRAWWPERPWLLLVAREGARVEGIAPLWRYARAWRGVSLRTIGFIAVPDTPEVDLLVRPENRANTLAAMADYLAKARRGTWDALHLSQWPIDSPNRPLLEARLAERGIRATRARASVVPFVAVDRPWDDFLKTRTYLFRKAKRGIMNRMARVEGAETRCGTGRAGADLLPDLFTISSRCWKHPRGVSMAASDRSIRFFEALTEVAGRRGWLRAWLLSIGRKPIAFEYDLECDGVLHALRAEYDEAHARQSPGAYVEYLILQDLFARGGREYRTGPGLDTYKLRWTEEARENVVVTAFAPTTAGRWAGLLERVIVPAGRGIRDRLASVVRRGPADGEGEAEGKS